MLDRGRRSVSNGASGSWGQARPAGNSGSARTRAHFNHLAMRKLLHLRWSELQYLSPCAVTSLRYWYLQHEILPQIASKDFLINFPKFKSLALYNFRRHLPTAIRSKFWDRSSACFE